MLLLPGVVHNARQLGYEPRWIATILAIQLAAVVFEGIGIGIILPILEYINAGGDTAALAEGSGLWRWMLDAAAAAGVPLNLVTLLAGAFIAIVVRQVFLYIRITYTAGVQYELMRRVRDLGFRRFIEARLDYHDRVRAGDFVNELTTELTRAAAAMTAATTFIAYLLLCAAYVVLAFALSATLTAVALVILAAAALILMRIMRRITDAGRQVTTANQQMSSFLVERLKSVRLIRLSAIEDAERAILEGRTRDQRDRLVDLQKLIALMSVLVEPIVVAIAFGLLYFAVAEFEIGFESILLFFFILIRLVPIIKEALLTRQGYLGSLASVEVVGARLADLEAARDPTGGERQLDRLRRSIDFRSITFRYGEDDAGTPHAAALSDVTLTIPARAMTALVGPSGAGKSTLVDLLPRLREARTGEILFDGVPQRDFAVASLRRAIAFAPQSPQIFNVTVAEHIRFGRREATMAEVREAARLAQAEAFIDDLPDGYDTPLGENGARLSGGQRQRLDLARALVRRAPILVLDEPTANLDAEAEALFREALQQIRRETDVTIIIIGHRLSTVTRADVIVVLEDGRVTEVGNHADLMARGGWYAAAYARQHGPELHTGRRAAAR